MLMLFSTIALGAQFGLVAVAGWYVWHARRLDQQARAKWDAAELAFEQALELLVEASDTALQRRWIVRRETPERLH